MIDTTDILSRFDDVDILELGRQGFYEACADIHIGEPDIIELLDPLYEKLRDKAYRDREALNFKYYKIRLKMSLAKMVDTLVGSSNIQISRKRFLETIVEDYLNKSQSVRTDTESLIKAENILIQIRNMIDDECEELTDDHYDRLSGLVTELHDIIKPRPHDYKINVPKDT